MVLKILLIGTCLKKSSPYRDLFQNKYLFLNSISKKMHDQAFSDLIGLERILLQERGPFQKEKSLPGPITEKMVQTGL